MRRRGRRPAAALLAPVALAVQLVALCGPALVAPAGAAEDLREAATALNAQGTEAFAAGRLGEAAKLFRRLDKLVGHLIPMGLTNLAVVYTEGGMHGKALKVYQKLVKRFPDDASVWLQYCRFGANVLNKKRPDVQLEHAKIESVCKKAVKLNPTEAEAAVLLGAVYTLAMQFEKSWPILEKAAALGSTQARNNLALSYLRGGRTEDSLKHAKIVYTNSLKEDESSPEEALTYSHVRALARRYDTEAVRLSLHARNEFVARMSRRGPNCPSGKWRILWNVSGVGAVVPGASATLLNPGTASQPFGGDGDGDGAAVRFAKRALTPYHTAMREHEVWRVMFAGGGGEGDSFVWASPGLVHGACTLLGGAFGAMYPTQDVSGVPEHAQHGTVDDADVISLAPAYNPSNYFHFLCEGLVRLLFALPVLEARPQAKLLLPFGTGGSGVGGGQDVPGYVSDALEILNVTAGRVVYPANGRTVLRFTGRLTVVDWLPPPGDTTAEIDSWYPVAPPRPGLRLLRSRFHDALRSAGAYADPAARTDVLYVSRGSGGLVRSIANEDALIAALRREFGPDRVKVHTGKEPLLSQAGMFQAARVVIGAHGAGLSNLAFCEPGTPLVLFPMKPHVDHTYGYMCAALELPQWVVTEVASNYYGTYGVLTDEQIGLAVQTAQRAIELTSAGRDAGGGGTRNSEEL